MAFLTVPELVLRATKGSPLTADEHDNNLKVLRNFSNALAALSGVVLKTDGSLKDDAVSEDAILNRAIGQSKLKLTAIGIYEDAGTTNNFVIAPDPEISAYEDGMIFFVRALNSNTGPATVKVNALETFSLKKQGGLELEAGDIRSGQVFAVAYRSSVFHLVSGSGAQSVAGSENLIDETGNLQGVIFNSSGDIAVVGTPVEFTHALDAYPDALLVALECIADDGAYVIGDTLPIGEVTDNAVTFAPTFRVRVDTNKVYVTRNSTNAYDRVGGSALDIATPKWKIRVKAMREKSPNLNMPPPQSFHVVRPDGAISYGQYIYVLSRGYSDADSNRWLRMDIQTGAVTLVAAIDSGRTAAHMSMYRSAGAGTPDMVALCSKKGIYATTLQKPAGAWAISTINTSTNYQFYKLLAIDDSTSTPTVWLGPQYGINTAKVNSYIVNKIVMTSGGAVTSTTAQTAINFTSAQDVSGFTDLVGAAAQVVSLTYNPVKKRLYLIDNSSGFLHVFELDDPLTTWLSTGALDYTKLHFVGSVILPASGVWSDKASACSESVAIEFDLGTGDESAVVFSKINEGPSSDAYSGLATGSAMPGMVTRSPWREPA